MNQEIVYGPALISFLQDNYEAGNFLNPAIGMMQQIQQDISCFDDDRKLDDSIASQIRETKNQLLLEWWTYICTTQRIPYKRISVDWPEKPMFDISDDILLEALVADKTKDKVWLNGSVDGVICLRLKQMLDMMPKAFETYLHPEHDDGILKLGVRWVLEANMKFTFFKYIEVCLRETSEIHIMDGYLVKDIAKKNLIKLLNVYNGHKILITTLSDRARNNYREDGDGLSVHLDLEVKLQKFFPDKDVTVIVTDDKKSLRQRLIITDKLIIDIGHGLDCFEDNYTRTQATFGVTLLQEN